RPRGAPRGHAPSAPDASGGPSRPLLRSESDTRLVLANLPLVRVTVSTVDLGVRGHSGTNRHRADKPCRPETGGLALSSCHQQPHLHLQRNALLTFRDLAEPAPKVAAQIGPLVAGQLPINRALDRANGEVLQEQRDRLAYAEQCGAS